MTDAPPATEAAAEPKPLAVVELDAFCEQCGFNLRSQAVWRDERLGLLVCRCPECGQHQSATSRATMTTPWLHRAAMLMTLAWVGLGLAFVAGLLFLLFGTQVAAAEGLTNRTLRAPDGTMLMYGGYEDGKQRLVHLRDQSTTQPAGPVTIGRTPVTWLGGEEVRESIYSYETPWQAFAVLGSMAVAAIYFSGAILAAACWYWRRGRRWAWLGLPPLVACVIAAIIASSEEGRNYLDDYTLTYDHRLEYAFLGAALAAQLAILALGLWSGRVLVRWILILFAPPGVRQLFAFLWHCDGKRMPPARTPAEAT